MICHSINAIGPAPQAVVKTARWNNVLYGCLRYAGRDNADNSLDA